MMDGTWWQMTFDNSANDVVNPGVSAQCRWQKNEREGQWAWTPNAENVRITEDGSTHILAPGNPDTGNEFTASAITHVEGWCCSAVDEDEHAVGMTWCYETPEDVQNNFQIYFWGQLFAYDESTGLMCHGAHCAQFKPLFVHTELCEQTYCAVEQHSCTKYNCTESSAEQEAYRLDQGDSEDTVYPDYCPNFGHSTCSGEQKTSIRVYHHNDEFASGHFCAITDPTVNKCECFCHDIYRNMERSPTFGEAVQMNTKIHSSGSLRKNCALPPAGKGDQYDQFSTDEDFYFAHYQYRPVGLCQGGGCWVVRDGMYGSNCMLPDEDALPFLSGDDGMCNGFNAQPCTGDTHSSQCIIQLQDNDGDTASFFRVMNNKGAGYSGSSTDGVYFKAADGTTLLHISPDGEEFQGQNDFNYFGDVPLETAFVYLVGGGTGADNYSGMTVQFFTCHN
jgi:hypothetical protein